MKGPATLNTLERREYLRNLTANLEFELRVMQASLDDDQGSTPEDFKEPKIFSWNVTYADFKVIRVQLSFNNTLYISTKDDKVNFFNIICSGSNTGEILRQLIFFRRRSKFQSCC